MSYVAVSDTTGQVLVLDTSKPDQLTVKTDADTLSATLSALNTAADKVEKLITAFGGSTTTTTTNTSTSSSGSGS